MSNHMSAVAAARHAAIRKLIAAHGAEFDQLHLEEREALGLPPRGADAEVVWLRQRVAELERA